MTNSPHPCSQKQEWAQPQNNEMVEGNNIVALTTPPTTSSLQTEKKQVEKTTPKIESASWAKLWHVYSYVILGGCDTIIYQYQNTTVVSSGKKFQHPFIQTFVMFSAMSMPLFWVIYRKLTKQHHIEIDHNKKTLSTVKDYLWILIPCLCDLIGSTLQFFSLLFIDSSIYQMMRGGSIIFTAIFSKYLFKKVFLKYKYLGLFVVIIGLIFVGLSQFIFLGSSKNTDLNMQYLSIGLLFICMALNGGHYTSEEFIYSKYNIHPCQLLGTEAFYGAMIYLTILLPIFCNVECKFPDGKGCVKVGDTYYFESVSQYIDGIKENGWLLTFVIFGIFSKCIYNLNGVFTTKYFSSLTRSVAGALRTLVTWVIGLIVTAAAARQWESLEYRTNLFKTAGYIFLFFGNLVYNGVIRLPYFDREVEIAAKKGSISNQIGTDEKLQLKKYESKLSSEGPLSIGANKTNTELK